MDQEAPMETRSRGIPPGEYFYEKTWVPILSDKSGYPRYRHFVNHMVKRIQAGNSNALEIQKFVNLIGSEQHSKLFTLAEEELRDMNVWGPGEVDRPSDPKNEHFLLFWYTFKNLKRKHEDSSHKMVAEADSLGLGREHGDPAGTMTESGFIQSVSTGGYDYRDGLSERELEILKANIFGPKDQWTITPEMETLFKSTVELGYPQEALEKAVRDAQASGRDIERDYQGLPVNLRALSKSPAKAFSSHHRMSDSIDALHFPQPLVQSSHNHPHIDLSSDLSRKHDQVPTSAHAREISQPDEHREAGKDASEDVAEQIHAAMNTPQGASKEQTTLTAGTVSHTSQMENVVPPVPTPQPTEPIDIPEYQTSSAPGTANPPVFTAETSPSVTIPVFPPGLMPTASDHPSTSKSPDVTDPQPPLRTAEEVESFARARARNCNLPQVPIEPPGPAWTPSELLWREQMMRRNEYILQAMARRERERLRAEEGLRKAIGCLDLDAFDRKDDNGDDQGS